MPYADVIASQGQIFPISGYVHVPGHYKFGFIDKEYSAAINFLPGHNIRKITTKTGNIIIRSGLEGYSTWVEIWKDDGELCGASDSIRVKDSVVPDFTWFMDRSTGYFHIS